MAKKTYFPVKTFRLTGASLSEERRKSAVRQTMSEGPLKGGGSFKPTEGVVLTRSATASGSGKISFTASGHHAAIKTKATKRAVAKKTVGPVRKKAAAGATRSEKAAHGA